MKKILIWDPEIIIQNIGGPSGYLYNIKRGLKEISNYSNIKFVSEILGERNYADKPLTQKNGIFRLIKRCNPLGLYVLLKLFYEIKVWKSKSYDVALSDIDLNEYDVIHFHSSIDLMRARELLNNYKGKIILTSHSPQPLSHERLDVITNNCKVKRIAGRILDKYELAAWERCDYLLFPVKESIDVYRVSKRLNGYINKINDSKLIYCPTSILSHSDCNSAFDIRKELGIPSNAIIISYIGRHNHIKGYDELLNFGSYILPQNPNIYFVIAGHQEPIRGLPHERWIELGWINYGNDLINQSNLFILPNKETYFDLIALEVLRVGTPLLMTRTGGNRYFEKFKKIDRMGIFFYEYGNLQSMNESFQCALKNLEIGEGELRESNVKLFKRHFTTEKFISNYIELLERI